MLGALNAEVSAISSLVDAPGRASERLLELAPRLGERARHAHVSFLAGRGAPASTQSWPGEHYRLLVALVQELNAQRVVEIGTHTGLGALALLSAIGATGNVTTFDIIPWHRIPNTYLLDSDFVDGRLTQHVADLGRIETIAIHRELLAKADLVFIDGPKDGRFERQLLSNLKNVTFKQDCILMFDDIRLWKMLDIWREISRPKLDITSFGHYTGTGLVDWNGVSGV